MKGTITWGIAAALLAVAGIVSLRIATVERLVADAQQDLATLNYDRAAQSLDEAEASIGLARSNISKTRGSSWTNFLYTSNERADS